MKKIYALIFITLFGISQVWAGQAHVYVYSSPTAGGFVDVQTSNTAPATYTYTQDHDQIGGTGSSGNKTFYLFYKANPGYKFRNWYKTNESNYKNNTTVTNTSDLTGQGQSVTQTATGIGAQNSYYAGVFIPINYYMVFHGNNNTGGSMSKQTIAYDASTKLTSNAFTRKYTVTYDANEGTCDETSAEAQYSFNGWAKSATGSVVYTNGQSVKNLTTTENEEFDLYAVWTSASVTLPEVSRDGFLFDGWYDGDTWVGKIGSSYTPTANTTLTAHWAEKLTPVFSLNKTEIELDQVAVLTMDNVNNPSIEITPAGIVNYNAETGELTGVGVGEVTISATQEAGGNLAYKHEELKLNVTLKTPSLSIRLNNIEQTKVTIIQGKTATATFPKESDAEVQVTTVSGGNYASYANGVLKAGEVGTAKFRATLPETNRYKGTYLEFTVTVEKDPMHLPLTMSKTIWDYDPMKVASEGSNSWDGSKGITLGDGTGGGFNYDDKYIILHFEGIPNKMTFELATTESPAGGATKVEWYIKESPTQSMPDSKIWTSTHTGTDFSSLQTVELQPTTRYVMLCYSGNFGGHIRNLQISELKYVQNPEPASIDFGSAVIYTGEVSKTVNVNWCNVAPLSVVSSNPKFTVTPSSFANYDQLGSQEITISYNHTNEVGDNSGVITISNGNDTYTKTIPVHAETTKRAQAITWHADLVATGYAMNVGEQYPDEAMGAVAVVPSQERVTFVSLDPEIIEVVADTALLAKKVGPVRIVAYQAGDNEYAEAKDTVLFTVTDLRKQTITWDQNLYGLLTTSAPVELTATATSGMEITYTSANTSVVRIEGNKLVVVGEGETYITAKQAGGVDDNEVEWLPISLNNYVIVRNPASQCNEMALSVNSLVLNSGQLSSIYDLKGTPTKLTFSAKHGEKANGAWGQKPNYAALMVDQYAKIDGVWGWQNIYNTVVGTDNTSVELALNAEATKVRFRTTETGTDHTISNIRVPRSKFMRADVTSFDEEAETNATWTKTITISHSNIDLMSLSTQNGLLTLSANTLGKGCGDYGDDAFTVSFTPTERDQEYNDVIVISDGKAQPTTINIPVHLQSRGLKQYLSGFELQASCLTTETIEMPQVTSTSELEVVFLSSDSTIAYVENNVLKILSAGKVTITAYQAGDNRYGEVSQSKEITINLTPVEITEQPTATAIVLGQALSASKLEGGHASVEGSFAWTAPETIPELGTSAHNVLFTPTKSAIYGTASTTVDVEVLPIPTTYGVETLSFCAGGSVEYEGKTYTEATEENVTLEQKNMYGGDSIVTLTVIVLQPTVGAESMEMVYGEDKSWNGIALNDSTVGTHFVTYVTKNAAGCDSTVTLTLTVKKQTPFEQEQYLSFCPGGKAEYAGKIYAQAGKDQVIFEGEIRDTIVNVIIAELPTYNIEEKDTVWIGLPYEWEGETRATDELGTFEHNKTFTTVAGCDSVRTLLLTVVERPKTYGAFETTLCQGDSLNYNGKWYKNAVQTNVTLDEKNIYGGDSIVALTIVMVYPTASQEALEIVYGDNEVWHGKELNAYAVGSHELKDTLTNIAGCDSVVTLTLTVKKQETIEIPVELAFCPGGEETYRGVAYSEAGEYKVPAEGAIRDTLYKINVSYFPTYAFEKENKTIYLGESYTWHDKTYKGEEKGVKTYTAEYATIHGCDSVYTLELTVIDHETTYGVETLSFCEGGSVEYEGVTYTEAVEKDVVLSIKNIYGGDSIVTLTVIVLQPTVGAESMEMVYGEDKSWNGIALNDSTVGTHTVVTTLTNIAGCDSVVTLTLTVNKQETIEIPVELAFCPGGEETYRGVAYSEAGEYKVPAEGAIRDTLYKVNVIVLQPTVGAESMEMVYGEDKSWNGIALNDSTVGTHTVVTTLTNIAGCDSVVTLTLTVNKQETIEIPVELAFCPGGEETYRGVAYSEAGEYKVPAEGVIRDTLYKINVSYYPTYAFEKEYKTIYLGESYTWHDKTYKGEEKGVKTYNAEYATIHGCDSVYTLELTVIDHETTYGVETLSFCEGGSVEYEGVTYTEAVEKDVVLSIKNIYGGDSIVALTVIVLQPTVGAESMEMVYGEDKSWNGIALNDSTVGTHTVVTTLTNIAGCDSVVTLTLTVNKQAAYELSKDIEFCEGDSAEYMGKWYYAAGEDKLTFLGEIRDTIITVNVTVHALSYTQESLTIVYEQDTAWNGIALGDSIVGTHIVTYVTKNATDCDSIVTLTLTVEPKPADQETPTGLDQTQTEVRATKVYRNGVIYIRRGEMLYGLDGKRIE